MSDCSYRINENVYIGQRVRMSKDKTTVEFKNIPMKGMKILKYDKMGFQIQHDDLPKIIYVDFEQLPLTELTIINGEIQDEITFVEGLVYRQMVLMKTDTDEYRQMLADYNAKKKIDLVKLSELKPGDIAISAICKNNTELVYLGNFWEQFANQRRTKGSHYYGYGEEKYRSAGIDYNKDHDYTWFVNSKPVKRAYFLSPKTNKIYEYPMSNKYCKEFISKGKSDKNFSDINENANIINDAYSAALYDYKTNTTVWDNSTHKRVYQKSSFPKDYPYPICMESKFDVGNHYGIMVVMTKKPTLETATEALKRCYDFNTSETKLYGLDPNFSRW